MGMAANRRHPICKFTEGVGIVVVERPNTGTAHVIIREQLSNKTDPG
jgi:hypothetical protein